MIKKKKGVVIYAMVLVYANSNIREITEELQKQAKEVVKATTGVNVIEVNIKVKNIYQKQKKSEVSSNIKEVAKVPVDTESVKTSKVEEVAKAEDEVIKEEVIVEDSVEDLDQIAIGETENVEEEK